MTRLEKIMGNIGSLRAKLDAMLPQKPTPHTETGSLGNMPHNGFSYVGGTFSGTGTTTATTTGYYAYATATNIAYIPVGSSIAV